MAVVVVLGGKVEQAILGELSDTQVEDLLARVAPDPAESAA